MSRAADKAPVSQEDSAEFEVRDDEEQKVKLTQTIELLLAAGYFRARIKGLSPFDKVVGGMTWCISTCSYDIDVDLLFQENSSIGQKIALTEKIVGALKRMKCPHRIEPHQIQGLDFIHIFPVVQWLVKKALETRQETGDYVRAFSISQFNKHHSLYQDESNNDKKIATINLVKIAYRPQRKYRRQDIEQIKDEESRVQSTLLEYGRKYGISRMAAGDLNSSKKLTEAELEKEERSLEEEEKYIDALMKGMSVTGRNENKLSAHSVSSIVNLQSTEIQQFAAEYAGKQPKQVEKGAGGAQFHNRMSTALQRQIDQQEGGLKEIRQRKEDARQAYDELKLKLQQVLDVGNKLDRELEKMAELEEQLEQKVLLDRLRHLVTLNEKLKKQEAEFRESCKEEMEKLQQSIEQLKKGGAEADGSQDEEHLKLIEQQFQSNREKLQNIRRLLGKRNREIAALQRRIDEVPTRAELSQYQCRFIELYNQVGAKHKETKQFFTLYNTLDDTRMYLNKEVNLLNSINDNFEQAMSSQSNRDQFLKQFEQIVDGVKQNRSKVDRRKQEEKMKRDELNDKLLEYLEKQRVYFKTVKDFQEECRKNEILHSKLPSA